MADITWNEPPLLESWKGVPALVVRYAQLVMRRYRNRLCVGIEARPGAPGTGLHHYLVWTMEIRGGKGIYQLVRTMAAAALDRVPGAVYIPPNPQSEVSHDDDRPEDP